MSCSSNSLPSLPTSGVDKIPLHYLTDKDKDHIASHLDMEGAWKMVAEAAGMNLLKISWISCRRTARGSETLILLDDLEKDRISLNEFIRAVNASSYKVQPVIDFLEKRFPGKKTHVLVTSHSQDSKQMKKVAKFLLKNGFGVSIDNQEELMKGSLVMGDQNSMRIQRIFDAADYVLVLVSPAFLKEVALEGNLPMDTSNPNFGCCLVAKLMRAKVKMGVARCDRYVVALLEGTGGEDLPPWMRPLRTYSWPSDYKNLLYFIVDPERVIQRFVEERNGRAGGGGHGGGLPLGGLPIGEVSCRPRCGCSLRVPYA